MPTLIAFLVRHFLSSIVQSSSQSLRATLYPYYPFMELVTARNIYFPPRNFLLQEEIIFLWGSHLRGGCWSMLTRRIHAHTHALRGRCMSLIPPRYSVRLLLSQGSGSYILTYICSAMRTLLHTPCFRGSWFPSSRGLSYTWLEVQIPSSMRLYLRGLDSLFEDPLVLEVLIPSSRNVLTSCFPPQDARCSSRSCLLPRGTRTFGEFISSSKVPMTSGSPFI